MKTILSALFIVLSSTTFGQIDTALMAQLKIMVDEDQVARHLRNGDAAREMERVDKKHNSFLKQVISRYHVYPGMNIIGMEGTNNFWVLVQHQDNDTAFQKEVLPLLKIAAAQGMATYVQYAYLYDRVLINTGKKQLYGTQCKYVPGSKILIPEPLEDSLNVDTRRIQMGLDSLHSYLKVINEHFK